MNTAWRTTLALSATIAFACGGTEHTGDPAATLWDSTEPEQLQPNALVASSGFTAITASSSDTGYPPENAGDGSLATRWRALGKSQYITGDLGQFKTVDGLKIAWYRGSLRKSTFQILVRLSDGTVRTVYSGQSSGTTEGLESYSFTGVSTRYLRVVVNGNTENDYASITELSVGGAAPATSPTPSPTPTPTPAVTVAISPSSPTIASAGTVQFTATVTGSTNTSVTWIVQEGASGGGISSTGLYTAPSSAGVYHVTATSSADPSKTATATITVSAAAPPGGLDVRSFGARGDGVTNDTAAFNAAIAAAKGGTVIVPGPATYIAQNVLVNVAGTKIECTGGSAVTNPLPTGQGPLVTNPAVIKLPVTTSNSSVFRVTANNVTFKNCVLDGQRSSQTCPTLQQDIFARLPKGAIHAGSSSSSTIALDGLTVQNMKMVNFCGLSVGTADVANVSVTDSYFSHLGSNALFASSPSMYPQRGSAVWRHGLTFSRNYAHDVKAATTNPPNMTSLVLLSQFDTVTIDDNDLGSTQFDVIKAELSKNVFIRRNKLSDAGYDSQNWPCLSLQGHALSQVISDNTFTHCAKGISFNPGTTEFATLGFKNITVSGNTLSDIHGGEPHAIIFSASTALTDILVENNTISDTGGMGIRLRQYSTAPLGNITVRGNKVTSAQYALSLQNDGTTSPAGMAVSGNTATSSGSYGCYRYGNWGTFTSWAGNTCSTSN